jgi:hypothetical protein
MRCWMSACEVTALTLGEPQLSVLLVEFGGGLRRERGRILARHDQAAANAVNPPATLEGVQIQKRATSPSGVEIHLVRSTAKDTSPNPAAMMYRSAVSRERGSRRNTTFGRESTAGR